MSTTNPFISPSLPSHSSPRRGGALSSLSLNQVVVKTEDICGNEKSTLTTKISSSDNPSDVIALHSDSLILGLDDDEGGDASKPTTSNNIHEASPAQSMEPEMARSVSCAAVPPPPTAAVAQPTPTKQSSFKGLSKSTPARTRTPTPSTTTFPSCTRYVPASAPSRSPPPVSFHRRVTPIPSSPSSPSTSQSRTAQWEARRAEELRRRAEEEKSMLDMLTSIDRGNEEQKLARKSINNVCSKPANAPSSSASPLSNKDHYGHAELGDDSSMSFIHQPPTTPHGSVVSGSGGTSSFQSYGSPVPSKPSARGTLSPQEHTDTEKSCNKTAADSEEEEEDDSKRNNNAASPVNDDIPDPCEATISGRTESSLEDVKTHEATKASSSSSIVADKQEEAKVESTSRVTPVSLSRSPQRAAAVAEVSSSLSPPSSQHRGGLLISPQRPSRTLTSAELRVAEAVSNSLARAQSQPRLSGTKGCSVTVSPFSSKAVSPVPLPQSPSSSSFVTAHPTTNNTTTSGSPLKVNSTNTALLPSIPSTPSVVMTSTVSSGTPLLLVSTATQMTPQSAVVVTTPGRAEVEEATPPPTPEATPPPPCTAEKEEQNELHSVAQEREEMEKSAVNEQSDAEAGEQESVAQAESQSDEESCTNNEEEVEENDDEHLIKNNEDNKKEDSHVEESATVAPETEEEEEPQKEILQMPIGRKRSRDTGSSPSLKASEDLHIECLEEHKAAQEREILERSEAAAAAAATAEVAPVLVVAVKSECDDENITPAAATTTTLVATRKKIPSAKLIKKALAAKEANKKKSSSDAKIHVAAADTTPLHIPKANLKHKLAQEHRERMREERDQKQPKKTNAASGGKKKKKK